MPAKGYVTRIWLINELAGLRSRAGLDQSELAEIARVSTATIQRLERGVPAKQQTVAKVFNALNELAIHQGQLSYEKTVQRVNAEPK